jgi:hypothetical protein
MAARGEFRISNPGGVDMTLTICMSVNEWKTIKSRLKANNTQAEWCLDDAINLMIEKAEKEFHFYEGPIERG